VVPDRDLKGALELLDGLGVKSYHIGTIHGREENEPTVVIE
jgi:hypothetical protein